MIQTATQLVLPSMDSSGTLFSDQPRRRDLPHVTEIINHLAKEMGEQYENEFSDSDLNAYAETGFIWENMLTGAWKRRLWQRSPVELAPQEEMEVDGVLMTPDWMELRKWVNVEAKATTRSRHKWDQYERYFWRWLMQVKSYCRALKTRRCDLYVWWVCGTWKPPVPEWWRYELEFTKRELDENWALILSARDRMGKGKGKGKR